MTTYTDEQVQEQVASATAVLRTELEELRSTLSAGEVQARIDAAVTEALAPVQSELDTARTERETATAELNALKATHDELIAEQEAIATAATAALELATRQTARVDELKAVATFTEDQIAERAPQWAAMEDEAFATLVETLKTSAASAPRTIVRPSPLTASEAPTGGAGGSVLAEALALSRRGVAPRIQN